jgi:poly(U)-specific endoribonuclease
MSFLQQKEVVTADPASHRELLKTLWFGMYSRGQGKISSSGFEHVFLSEVRNGTVLGLHNWIYLSEAESAQDLDYKGWLKKIDLGNVRPFTHMPFSFTRSTLSSFRKDKLPKFVSL